MTRSYILTLLRHGESEGNAEGRWQGQMDFPLTKRGREQAQRLAERWAAENRAFDSIISSPLARALETAQIVAGRLNRSLTTDPVWKERDNGNLAGSLRNALPPAPPENIYERIGSDGESESELFLRAGAALHSILGHSPGRFLIVAHGGILNSLLRYVLGIAPQPGAAAPRFSFGNTGFTTIEFRGEQNVWIIRGLNDQAHLSGSDALLAWEN